jgi:hypothetical protein
MWFFHKRLKDKKDVPAKRPRKAAVAAALPESPVDELRVGETGSDYRSGSGLGSRERVETAGERESWAQRRREEIGEFFFLSLE